MFLMSLDIGAELELAMFGVVHTGAYNNRAWAEGIRDPIIGGEAVEPEHTVVDHLDGQSNGEVLEW
jgi:predicted metal-dependent TIM-barrel fold hydrolase